MKKEQNHCPPTTLKTFVKQANALLEAAVGVLDSDDHRDCARLAVVSKSAMKRLHKAVMATHQFAP